MKRRLVMFLIGLVGFLGMMAVAGAAPFLICDVYPAGPSQPTEFETFLDGSTTPIISPAQPVTGGVRLYQDVASVSVGSHTVTVKAVRVDPTYGRLTSASSAPFSWVKPATPAVATGIGLAP
jgi:hypothetical protein